MKTIEDVENYLRTNKVSGILAVRLKKIALQFATVDAFFCAKKTDIEKMYSRLTPGGKKGIGKRFWKAFDMALAYYNGLERENVKPEHKEAGLGISPRKDVVTKAYTYKELKAIVDMMELLDIEQINLIEIAGFLENVRFRKNEEEAKNDSSK